MNNYDFLLLNASNTRLHRVYSYAFVQVSEVARRFGLRVKRLDLYDVPENQWKEYLKAYITQYNPKVIGITLRNTDSLVSDEYLQLSVDTDYLQPKPMRKLSGKVRTYFPIHNTKLLIDMLRSISNNPIVVGGYGFSTMPERIMNYLEPDFGVRGGSDSFFENFENIIERNNLYQVSNLLYYDNDQLLSGNIEYFAPAPNREYTEEIIRERNSLISNSTRIRPLSTLSIPVEVSRGCPNKCYFCSEPLVKGAYLRFRDMEVIIDEIEYLGHYKLSLFWFLCSEINALNNEWVLNFAERLIKINEKRCSLDKVQWYSYSLPKYSLDELRLLMRAGYLGHYNSVSTLDEDNLKRLNEAYNSDDIINHYKNIAIIKKDHYEYQDKIALSLEEKIYNAFHQDDRQEKVAYYSDEWFTFLGNPFMTIKGIRSNLYRVDKENLNDRFIHCYIMGMIRTFEYCQDDNEPILHQTTSISKTGIMNHVDLMYPTFSYSKELLLYFKTPKRINEFFIYLQSTHLSKHHLLHKKWHWFLANLISIDTFSKLYFKAIEILPAIDILNARLKLTNIKDICKFLEYFSVKTDIRKLSLLYNPSPGWEHCINYSTDIILQYLFIAFCDQIKPVLEKLRIPYNPTTLKITISEYKITRLFYKYADTKEQFIDYIISDMEISKDSIEYIYIEYLFYMNNIDLKSEYKTFFIDDI